MNGNITRSNHRATTVQLSVLTVAAVVLLVINSFAAGNKSQQSNKQTSAANDNFARADENHDGKLSRAEASDFLVEQIFDASDLNHDGKVTKEEWTKADPTLAAGFKKRDANHDGVISKEEAIKYGRKHGLAGKPFRDADKNGDGYLSKAEVQAYYASREGPPR